MRFFRDPSWQFVAVVLAAVGLFVAIFLFFTGRPFKALRVEVLSNSPVISVNADVASDIQFTYKGKPVQTLALILLKLENTGNQPITESDYSQPILISLSQNAQIGEVSLQETRPNDIPLTSTQPSSNQIELAKVLLNPGDQAILKVLVLNNDGSLRIDGRIAGIPEIEKITGLQSSNAVQLSLSVWPVFALVAGIYVLMFAIVLIANARWFQGWRKRRGHDPARGYYQTAQDAILSGEINATIRALDRAFSWDKSYVERSQKDSVFSSLQDYSRYKRLIDKYKLPKSESSEEEKTPAVRQE